MLGSSLMEVTILMQEFWQKEISSKSGDIAKKRVINLDFESRVVELILRQLRIFHTPEPIDGKSRFASAAIHHSNFFINLWFSILVFDRQRQQQLLEATGSAHISISR